MNQKCFICDNSEVKIIDRPKGYDGKLVICTKCTQYKISRTVEKQVKKKKDIDLSLSDKVKNYYENEGKPYEINSINLKSK